MQLQTLKISFVVVLTAVIPSMVVTIAVGRRGIDTLLVLSQVVLSIVLPFITLPLIYVTGSRGLMWVRASEHQRGPTEFALSADVEGGLETRDFSNGWVTTVMACAIWLLVSIVNVYVLTTVKGEVEGSTGGGGGALTWGFLGDRGVVYFTNIGISARRQ
ncbi:Manganese transporter smf1 [Marasmius tenuissimus]|nr:Manganese transporter smf1 [Marasmius tenuissimus]